MPRYFYDAEARKYRSKLAELQGDTLEAFGKFNSKAFAAGALSVKEKELIAIAAAHITHCPYCIDGHVRRAKEAGATDKEIAEAIMVAVAMAAGSALAHSNLAMQTLSE